VIYGGVDDSDTYGGISDDDGDVMYGGSGQNSGGNGYSTPMVGAQPIILDLNDNGVEVSLPASVHFDMDNDGFLERTYGWAGRDDGFLVIDLNFDGSRGAGDGKIDQTRELILSEWGNAGDTDLQALARRFDKDAQGKANGVFDANDVAWKEFRVWQDLDQDGVTDQGELIKLEKLGITKINLTYDDGSGYGKTSDDIDVGAAVLHGLAAYSIAPAPLRRRPWIACEAFHP
jgi:hypothetical protein